jgi:hypothetical protein
MNPKVFVSHASEDKERFVVDFARKLRARGIDAWLDQWEMFIGDSLIDRIFEEGIKDADAIIIVLSNNSVSKPWVREELNVSLVNKIEKGTRVIPIVLDGCNVPESLKPTLWQSIDNLNDYSNAFDKIVSSIYGMNDKPELGTAPSYSTQILKTINGLTKSDNLVLKMSCEHAINENDIYTQFNPITLSEVDPNLKLTQEEIDDCVEILENVNYLKVQRMLGGYYIYFLTENGFNSYAEHYIENYESSIETIISLIVNRKIDSNYELIEESKLPSIIVNAILFRLENSGMLKLSKTIGDLIHIMNTSANLRRLLDS